MKRSCHILTALILSLSLLAGCGAAAAPATETPTPEPPSTVPEEAVKNEIYELLSGVFDNYHAGTAGCSLTAAWYAASLTAAAKEYGLGSVRAGAMAWDRGMETEFGESFADKLQAVYAAGQSLTDGMLDDCGYTGERDFTPEEVRETFETLFAALGLTAPEETAAPGEAAEASGRVVVSVYTEKEDIYSEDEEQLLLSFACPALSVDIPGREAAAAAVNGTLDADRTLFIQGDEEAEGSLTGREMFLSAAREELQRLGNEGAEDNMTPFALTRSVEVGRGDGRVLSLEYADTTYMGGAHGYVFHWARTFDTLTGEELTLADLTEDGEAFLDACAGMLREVAGGAEYAMAGFYEDYTDALPDLLRDNNWYFGDDGLVVIANAYEIGPYAAGEVEFTLPYAWLRWHIKPEYIPETAADGALTGELREEAGGTTYTVDDGTGGEGAAVVFTAQGRVEDVSVHHVRYLEYNEDYHYGNLFFTEDLLWYASALEAGETLCLRTWIPEIIPDLAVTWTDGSGTSQTAYISQSGQDGSLVLLDAKEFLPLPVEISGLVPLAFDIDGDGEKEMLELRHTEDETSSLWEVLVDGAALPGSLFAWGDCRLWLCDLDNDGTAELFLTGDMGSDDYVTMGWHGDTRRAVLFTGEDRYGKDPADRADTLDGQIVFSGGWPVLESWNYQLGTYYAARAMELEDGSLSPVPGSRWEYRRNEQWLTVKKNLAVTLDELGRAVLTPGTTLRLLSAEGDIVHFITGDGEPGTILLEHASGEEGSGWLIGGVSEDEYFEFLPYAG